MKRCNKLITKSKKTTSVYGHLIMVKLAWSYIISHSKKLDIVPLSWFEFTWIDHAVTSPPANQPVAPESERARDQWQCAAVTPQFKVFCSCLKTFNLLIYRVLFTDPFTNSIRR